MIDFEQKVPKECVNARSETPHISHLATSSDNVIFSKMNCSISSRFRIDVSRHAAKRQAPSLGSGRRLSTVSVIAAKRKTGGGGSSSGGSVKSEGKSALVNLALTLTHQLMCDD